MKHKILPLLLPLCACLPSWDADTETAPMDSLSGEDPSTGTTLAGATESATTGTTSSGGSTTGGTTAAVESTTTTGEDTTGATVESTGETMGETGEPEEIPPGGNQPYGPCDPDNQLFCKGEIPGIPVFCLQVGRNLNFCGPACFPDCPVPPNPGLDPAPECECDPSGVAYIPCDEDSICPYPGMTCEKGMCAYNN